MLNTSDARETNRVENNCGSSPERKSTVQRPRISETGHRDAARALSRPLRSLISDRNVNARRSIDVPARRFDRSEGNAKGACAALPKRTAALHFLVLCGRGALGQPGT